MRGPFAQALRPPVVYLALWSAYAGLCFSLLLDGQASFNALYDHVLTTYLVNEMALTDPRARCLQFAFTRLPSSWLHLSRQTPQVDNLPLLINRSMERLAWLCREGASRRPEFKRVYTNVNDKMAAEQVFAQVSLLCLFYFAFFLFSFFLLFSSLLFSFDFVLTVVSLFVIYYSDYFSCCSCCCC